MEPNDFLQTGNTTDYTELPVPVGLHEQNATAFQSTDRIDMKDLVTTLDGALVAAFIGGLAIAIGVMVKMQSPRSESRLLND